MGPHRQAAMRTAAGRSVPCPRPIERLLTPACLRGKRPVPFSPAFFPAGMQMKAEILQHPGGTTRMLLGSNSGGRDRSTAFPSEALW